MPKGVELVETPTAKMDNLALVTELLEHRQAELDQTQHQLTLLEARIVSEKAQWSQQKVDLERESREELQRIKEHWQAKVQEAEQVVRAHQQSLAVQQAIEQEAERRMQEITRKEEALADLNRERVEIEQLRLQVQTRSDEVEGQWSQCQAALTNGHTALAKSEQLMAVVETRTQQLNELESSLRRREEAVVLKEKHLEIVQQQLAAHLTREGETNAESAGQSGGGAEGLGHPEATEGSPAGAM